jgi:VIT1/CCC1 family predicted Fe2+/Mn2+ transporter
VAITFAVVVVALALTGSVSAALGKAGHLRAIVRLVVGGALAMLVTFGIGALLGAHVS